MNNIGENC